MPPYHYFIQPVMNPQAQVAIMALMVLALMDVLFGVLNAWFFQHDFSSHEFRQGLIRKLSNFGVVIAADVVDAMLLGGLDLGFQPVLMTVTVSLSLMELVSLMEIFAEMHPEISESLWWQMLAHSKDSLNKEGE
ncbi:MAG: phage holin family protein [Atopobiaceae bacterium]|nr:phage holin family protein [Atopobiaceae bacterium]